MIVCLSHIRIAKRRRFKSVSGEEDSDVSILGLPKVNSNVDRKKTNQMCRGNITMTSFQLNVVWQRCKRGNITIKKELLKLTVYTCICTIHVFTH